MWGAIIGDIVGSRFEFNPIKTKDFEFFHPDCFITDDTICTAAIADILLHDKDPSLTLQDWCRRYPDMSYGNNFSQWIKSSPPEPYDSYGNGSAMRISPVAHLFRHAVHETVQRPVFDQKVYDVTDITHNHPEGLKGAHATAWAICLAFSGMQPEVIRQMLTMEYSYDFNRKVDDIRFGYEFDETCQGSVSEAILCAIESKSFRDAIRNAVSLGGDADTQGAIAGAIAEAIHGVPDPDLAYAREYLRDAPDVEDIMDQLYR